MGKGRRRKNTENRMGKICISGIDYLAKEKELSVQLEEATEEQQKLADYERYTQSQEYIEEVAKSKLGLVYNNEIVFKEQNEEDN